jgi:hypothetical protein
MSIVIETGKNLNEGEFQTRVQTRFDPTARYFVPVWWEEGSGSLTIMTRHTPQKCEQDRTVTTVYEWSLELVSTGTGTALGTASRSDTVIVTTGYDTVQVLPGYDLIKRWKQTVTYGSWGSETWVDTEGDPVGWKTYTP